ncbi:MAG: radical SAM protein [Gemmatimonadaceae bacterium]|nr:radical SAM protein [Gloeobacterales cyanobacterium ES-bin-141]
MLGTAFEPLQNFRRVIGDTFTVRSTVETARRGWRVIRTVQKLPLTPATMPLGVQVETTNYCNFKCIMCNREVLPGMDENHLTLQAFKRLIAQIQPAVAVMNGLGEPLMDRTIFDKLDACRRAHILTTMPTNLSFVRGERLERLLASPPNILQLSIDGGERTSYEAIRGRADYDQIMANFWALSKRYDHRSFHIRVLIALQRLNLGDFEPMYAMMERSNFNEITVVPFFDYGHTGEHFRHLQPMDGQVDATVEQINAVLPGTRGKRRNFYIRWRGAVQQLKPKSPQADTGTPICLLPWYSTYLDAKLNVYPCCFLQGSEHVMGNLSQQSVAEVWQGERYAHFRSRMLHDRGNLAGCRTCPQNDRATLDALRRLP